jgi:hypothetical protein
VKKRLVLKKTLYCKVKKNSTTVMQHPQMLSPLPVNDNHEYSDSIETTLSAYLTLIE